MEGVFLKGGSCVHTYILSITCFKQVSSVWVYKKLIKSTFETSISNRIKDQVNKESLQRNEHIYVCLCVFVKLFNSNKFIKWKTVNNR